MSGRAQGTTPPGACSEQEAAHWVRSMFGRVAHRYDLLNHLLSFNLDRRWRAHTVARVCPALGPSGVRIVDLCCGTGDLALELAAASRGIVMGSDFCRPMLLTARRKAAQRHSRVVLFEADALRLPLPDGSVDLATVAFGFRNLTSYGRGLEEMLRVLKSGGVAAILEFSQPENRVLAGVYGFYSRRVLPAIGGTVSGDRTAYEYLPESVRKFPAAAELAEEMRRAGFREVAYERLTGGIVALHLGTK